MPHSSGNGARIAFSTYSHVICGWKTNLMINKLAEPAQKGRQEMPVSTHHLHKQGETWSLPAEGENHMLILPLLFIPSTGRGI